jgi:hypothetical protein
MTEKQKKEMIHSKFDAAGTNKKKKKKKRGNNNENAHGMTAEELLAEQ